MVAKVRLINLLLCLITVTLFAKPISKETALKIAVNWLNSNSVNTKLDAINSTNNITHSFEITKNFETLIYVFNFSANGFVLVSGDDSTIPILGYSYANHYNPNNLPPSLTNLIESYKEQITKCKLSHLIPDQSIQKQWNDLETSINTFKKTSDVKPLITTKWNQGKYYNAMCPSSANGPDGKALVGCSAVAIAQIMKHFSYPPKGFGSILYGMNSYDLSNEIFNWANMPDSISDYNDEVARILNFAAIACKTSFGSSESFANSDDIRNALVNNFGYSPFLRFTSRFGTSDSMWCSELKKDIDRRVPIAYGADTSSTSLMGHLFIVDGYNSNDLFHCNWGWGGLYDGYFTLMNFNPGKWQFLYNHKAFFFIKPSNFVFDKNDIWNGSMNLTGIVSILPNVTITINPGTKLALGDSSCIGISGAIKAIGTKTDSIIFSPFNKDIGWNGIFHLAAGVDSSIYKYCKFEYGKANPRNSFWDIRAECSALNINRVDNVSIDNCMFFRNSNAFDGAATIFVVGNGCVMPPLIARLNITNSCFVENTETFKPEVGSFASPIIFGAGWYNVSIKNCLFYNNTMDYVFKGTGLDELGNLELINCTFKNNLGGILFVSRGSVKTSGCLFENNICDISRSNKMIVIGSWNNECKIYNCTFTENKSYNYIFVNDGNNTLVKNCIFYDDNIQWWNNQLVINNGIISYCNVKGGKEWIVANTPKNNIIDRNPKFVKSGNYTSYLSSSSQCINAGDPEITIEELGAQFDLMGNHRIIDGKVDIGAYEFNPEMVAETNKAPVFTQKMNDQVVKVHNVPVEFAFQYQALDSDGDSIIFRLINGPENSILTNEGLFKWTPKIEHAGGKKYQVIISISDGYASVSDTSVLTTSQTITMLNEELNIPREYYLNQNFPNPFNPVTKINYSIPKACFVSLRVYNMVGEEISVLVNEEKLPGKYEIEYNGVNLSSGIYFYIIQAENFSATRKFILLK